MERQKDVVDQLKQPPRVLMLENNPKPGMLMGR